MLFKRNSDWQQNLRKTKDTPQFSKFQRYPKFFAKFSP